MLEIHEGNKTKICVTCGAKVEGTVDGVALTLCCMRCCLNCNPPPVNKLLPERHLVSGDAAQSLYGCRPGALNRINCQRVASSGSCVNFYLLAEVVCIGRAGNHGLLLSPSHKHIDGRDRAKREGIQDDSQGEIQKTNFEPKKRELNPQTKATSKRRRHGSVDAAAIQNKIANLEQILGCRLVAMDAVLRCFLLGDYLTQGSGTQMTREDVEARCGVLERVKWILAECSNAHPDGVFTFCLQNPDGGVKEFLDLREKVRRVMHLEGFRILHFAKGSAPDVFLSHLTQTPLADVYSKFKARNPVQLIRSHLLQWFDRGTIEEIVQNPIFCPRIWLGGPEDRVAEALRQAWNPNKETARQAKAILASKGICASERTDMIRPAPFLNVLALETFGSVQVAAVIREAGLDRRTTEKAIERFKWALSHEGASYDEAIQKAMDVTWDT